MCLWPYWRSALIIVQPETVVRWHRQGFRLYWRWKSRVRKPGRPAISAEVVALIRRMCRENPTDYYHHARTHLSLDRNSPIPRRRNRARRVISSRYRWLVDFIIATGDKLPDHILTSCGVLCHVASALHVTSKSRDS